MGDTGRPDDWHASALAQETSPTCNFIYAVKLELVDSVPTCTDIWDRMLRMSQPVRATASMSSEQPRARLSVADVSSALNSPLTATEWGLGLDEDCQYFDSAIDLKTGEAGGGCDAAFTPEFID